MNTTCGIFLAFAAASVAAMGCEVSECAGYEEDDGECIQFESLKEFRGGWKDVTVPWETELNLTVDGIYGDIEVLQNEASNDEVRVEWAPFAWRGASKEDEAQAQREESIEVTAEAGKKGVEVIAVRDEGVSNVGANIRVYLPGAFDGTIDILAREAGPVQPGDVFVGFTGLATAVKVDNWGLGESRVLGTTEVVSTTVQSHGPIQVDGVADQILLETWGLENTVRARVVEVAVDAESSHIYSEDGEVELTLPANAELRVRADTQDGQAAVLSDVPEDCERETINDSSLRVECGEQGPLYEVRGGVRSVGDSNVRILFE